MLRPAFIMGPLLGGLGGVMLAVAAMVDSGPSGGGFALVLFGFFGLILGLVIATPICLVSGSILLWLGASDTRWLERRRWLVTGAAAGGLLGLGIAALEPSPEMLAVLPLSTAFLGLVGAFGNHRLLAERLARLNQVDADVFG